MASERLDITFDSPADVDLFDGSVAEVRFAVRNPAEEASSVELRIAVMNAFGQENPGAAELPWFALDAPADPAIESGGSIDCTVRAAVPRGTAPQTIVWALVACDAERGNDSRSYSQPLCLDVKNVEPDPPAEARGGPAPWWVWLIVAFVVAAIVVAVVLGTGG